MKKIIFKRPIFWITCSALFLTGCDHQIQGASILASVAACENHGGIAYAYSYQNHAMGMTVVCNDFTKIPHIGKVEDNG